MIPSTVLVTERRNTKKSTNLVGESLEKGKGSMVPLINRLLS